MTKAEAREIRDAVEDVELPTDALYEIIDGRVVEVSGMGPSGCVIASRLASHLGLFTQRKRLGRLVFETLFRIATTTYRRPNLAFVSFERWAKDAPPPDSVAWKVIPDLMIDVVDPTDEA